MKTSRFNAEKAKAIVAGQRVSNDEFATLTAGRAMNNFNLNGKATSELGVKAGDRVELFELESETMEGRFFIGILPEGSQKGAGVCQAAKVKAMGSPATFTYSGAWAKIIQLDPASEALSKQALIDNGTLVEFPTMVTETGENLTNHLLEYEVEMRLELDSEDVEVEGVKYSKLFILTGFEKKELDAPTVINRKVKPNHKKSEVEGNVTSTKGADESLPKGVRL